MKEATKATSKNGALSDPKKVAAAGIGIAALPVAVEQIAKRVAPKVSDLGEQAKDKISDVSPDLGAAKQVAKGAAVSKLDGSSEDEGGGLLSKLNPFLGGRRRRAALQAEARFIRRRRRQGQGRARSGGSGRRMPIQQSVDVAVPIKVAYNRWTCSRTGPSSCTASRRLNKRTTRPLLLDKMWGLTRRFEAEIVEQRPDERIEWNVTEGPSHTGVVTFHRSRLG